MACERLIRSMRRLIACVVGHRSRPARSAPSLMTAYHEAGHAVAAVALSIGLVRVSIVGDWDTLGQIALNERWPHLRPEFDPRDPRSRRIAESWILISLAGEFADASHGGRSPDPDRPEARWDFRHARDLVERLFDHPEDRDAFFEAMQRRAHEFVSEPVRWSQISAVATQLCWRRQLDGQEVRDIMDVIAALAAFGGARKASPTIEPRDP